MRAVYSYERPWEFFQRMKADKDVNYRTCRSRPGKVSHSDKKMLKGEEDMSKSAFKGLSQYFNLNYEQENYLNWMRVYHSSTDQEVALKAIQKALEIKKRYNQCDDDFSELTNIQAEVLPNGSTSQSYTLLEWQVLNEPLKESEAFSKRSPRPRSKSYRKTAELQLLKREDGEEKNGAKYLYPRVLL